MLGHHRARLGQVNHLTPFPFDLQRGGQVGATPTADRRLMGYRRVGRLHQAQCRAWMPGLAALVAIRREYCPWKVERCCPLFL